MINTNEMKNFWKDKSVLITGHTGFKGSWMSLLLSTLDANIIGLSNDDSTESKLYKKNVFKKHLNKELFFDISKENSKEYRKLSKYDFDIVFHFAAQSLVSNAKRFPYDTYKTNVLGTLNLIEYLNSLDRKISLVVATTDKVYKNPSDTNTEEFPLEGFEFYGSSKVSVEKLIDTFLNLNPNSKLQISKVRCGNVLGGGESRQTRLLTEIIEAIETNKKFIVRSANSIRPWLHILDALYGYCLTAVYLYNSGNNEVFNLSNSSEEYSVNDLVNAIMHKWDVQLDISNIKTKTYLEADILRINSNKAKQVLGWQPIIKFEEMVDLIVDWEKGKFNLSEEKVTLNQIENFLKVLS
jgi:CDP-glucose 4,6-dehydratase